MARVEGILFDLGDTLIDYGKVNVNRLFHAGGRLAYDYLKSIGQPVPSFARYYLRQLASIYWHNLYTHLTGKEFNSLEIMTRLGGRWGQKLTADQELELAWRWYEPLSESAIIEPELRQTLIKLKDMGLKLAVVSNTFVPGAVLDRHLQTEGILDMFDLRIYSCEVELRKPSREIFQLALRKASLTPEKTLFVGDSPKADIMGAFNAGLIPVLKDPDNKHIHKKLPAAHRISEINELIDIVRIFNS